ncbi:MAG: ammonia-forming cytochrome c nitrite reductase subunit c552 [Anaerolineae bacterium]
MSCADCHMPYTRGGAAKFSSHNIKSPLLMTEASCGASCHTDVTYVVERAKRIQDQVHETVLAAEDALIAAIEALKAAADVNVDESKLAEARVFHREARLRWDSISAENSMGFHNPGEALRILAAAIDMARQAQLKAIAASQAALLASALR